MICEVACQAPLTIHVAILCLNDASPLGFCYGQGQGSLPSPNAFNSDKLAYSEIEVGFYFADLEDWCLPAIIRIT